MWAVVVKKVEKVEASDISVSEQRCLDELFDYVKHDGQIVGVRLMPPFGLTWYWNHPDWK